MPTKVGILILEFIYDNDNPLNILDTQYYLDFNMKSVMKLNENYLQYDFFGEYNYDDFVSSFDQIKQDCEHNQIFSIYLDLTKVKNSFPDQLDRYYIGLEIAKRFAGNYKIAALGKFEDINYYSETVAKNRNVNLKVFTNRNIALRWLIGKKLNLI